MQTSGLTIKIARAWPSWMLLAAFWMPNVAEEHADVHVKAEAFDAQGFLDFDGDGR